MIKIALYDIDYTIISINSLLDFFIFYLSKKPLRIFLVPYSLFCTMLWGLKIISTKKAKEQWLIIYNGLSRDETKIIIKEFCEKVLIPKIKPNLRENINQYRNKGYKIVFATASFEFYMKPLADYLKADYFFGTKVEIKNNKLQAKIDGENCKGREKINRILKTIPKENIKKEESHSYSDSNSDLPFLEITNKFHKVKRKSWEVKKVIN